jgi:hypothetical protein
MYKRYPQRSMFGAMKLFSYEGFYDLRLPLNSAHRGEYKGGGGVK